MTQLIASEAMLQQLRALTQPVDIVDAEGKVLGRYTPVTSSEKEEQYREAMTLFDPKELERLAQTKQPGYTIDQVMEHLRSLEKTQ